MSSAPPSTRPTRPARSPRTIEEEPREPRFPRAGERLANVTSGVWAALQGAALSFAVVALLAVVGTLGTSTDDGAWAAATSVAVGLWLLGQGVPLDAGDGAVTLIPLGIGALALFTVYVSAKRSALPSAGAWWGGTAATMVMTTALAALTGAGGVQLAPRVALAALAGLVVGGGGMALGMLGGPDGISAAELGRRLDPYLPDVLRLGLRAGGVAVAGAVAAAAVLAAVWIVAGRATSDDIVESLDPGWVGGGVLAVAQLALLPNLVAWALAWIAGPGFAVGQDTVFSATATQAGPLPAIPLLGALPGPDWSGSAALWLPVVLVGCGVLAGWYAWRELAPARGRWVDVAWIVGGVAITAALAIGVLQWWASGSVGPGRLSDVGADPLIVGGVAAAEAAVGAALVLTVGRLRAR